MIFITILLLFIYTSYQQVDHSPIEPKVVDIKIRPTIKTIPSRHSFAASYQGIGYQISGNVYETNDGLLNEQIHNKTFYRNSTSCTFFNSELSLDIINQKSLQQGFTIQSSFVSQQTKSIFLLVSDDSYNIDQNHTNRVILIYAYSEDGYSQSNSSSISLTTLGLNDSEIIDIQMVSVKNTLIITDGVKMVGISIINPNHFWNIRINTKNSSSMTYEFASQNQLLQFDLCHINIENNIIKIVAVWNTMIMVYHFDLNVTIGELTLELTPPKGKFYTGAVIDHNFYALIEGQLVTYRMDKNMTYQTDYVNLQSQQCWGIDKFQSTLHMICKEGELNYIAEFYFNQSFVLAKDALKLNRYYTNIDDVKLIFRFGGWLSPKLMMSGDNDVMLTAYGINRQVLIDSDKKQVFNRFKSLGLENILTVDEFTTVTSTFAIGIGTTFITFFRLKQSPSQIQCNLERKDNMIRWNILVQINTTNCFANGDIVQLESICQTSIPYTLYVSLFEVDRSKEMTVHIFVYAVLIICAILLVGVAFHCKKIRNVARTEIEKKIASLKKKKNKMMPI